MLRFRSLGSGSSGNATLVEAFDGLHRTRVLIDCGFGIRQLDQRLQAGGVAADSIDAVFITHEHGDHIGCAAGFVLRQQIPVWMSEGTWRAIGSPDLQGLLRLACDGVAIDVNGLQLRPFTVPHDAREPLQLRCTDGAASLGVLTDLGHVTRHVASQLQGCEALLLECNHDTELLQRGAYPPFLKQRVGGPWGHLCNADAAALLGELSHPRLRHVVAAHLSEQNNRPDLARAALAAAWGAPADEVQVADAATGCDWRMVG